jgi:hypothetical protein
MKDLLDKLTSYNLFNYLLPGVIFAALVDSLTTLKLIQANVVIGVFVYYFLGLIISRAGSLVIEPGLKKVGFLKFASYADFLIASKNDPKIEILTEANNMYRTFCAMFILVAVVKIYNYASAEYAVLAENAPYFSIAALLALFLVSYRKQTTYITKRVKENM